MGRLSRPTEDGLVYHAPNRGNNRADVFAGAEDQAAFLESLAKTQERYPFRLFGYCLMTTHFHLLLRAGLGQSISRILQSLTVARAWRYHKRHHAVGHVWQGRFRSPVIEDDEHLLAVLRDIEANPLRAGMVIGLGDYPWSSYPAHGLGRPDALVSPMPEFDALGRSPAERQSRWRRKVHATQKQDEIDGVRESLRSGKPPGTSEFVETKAQILGLDLNPRRRGRPRTSEK
jgi:putative transposase